MRPSRLFSPYSTRLLQLAFTLLGVIYMLFIGGSFDATVRFRPQLLNAAAAGVTGLIWLLIRIREHTRVQSTGLEWPLIALVLSQWIATAAAAQPRLSLETAASVTAWAVVFIILCDLFARGWPQAFVLDALVLVALIVALSVLGTSGLRSWQWLEHGQLPPLDLRASRPDTFVGNPNLNAIILNLLLPVWVVRLCTARPGYKRLIWGMGTLAIVLAIILVASRSGWLIVLLELILMWWLLKAKASAWVKSRWQAWPRPRRLGSMLVVAGLLGIAAWPLLPPISRYLLGARQDYWQPAWRMFLASPLVGGGPGQHLQFQLRFYSVPPQAFFPHAHSLILEVLGNSGLAGGIALLGVGLASAKLLAQRWRHATDRRLTAALLCGLAGACLHQFADYFFGTPGFTFLFLLASALACASPKAEASPSQSTFHPAWLGLPMALVLAITALALRGAAFNTRGIELALEKRWSEAGQAFEQAAKLDRAFPLYWENAAQAFTRAGDIDRAIPLWQQAARQQPTWAIAAASLAMVTRDSNTMHQALALAPQSYLLALNAGALAEAEGDLNAAQAYYGQALDLNPAIADALFWQQTHLRREVLNNWQAQRPVDQALIAQGWAALRAQDYDRAQLMFDQACTKPLLSIQGCVGLARVWLARDNPERAQFYLNEARELPNFLPADTLAFQIALGDLALAQHDPNSARDAYGMVFGLVSDYMSTGGIGTYGYSTRSWWLFHREGLPGDLIPQLVRADITTDIDASLAHLAQGYLDDGEPGTACYILEGVYREAPVSESGLTWQKVCSPASR